MNIKFNKTLLSTCICTAIGSMASAQDLANDEQGGQENYVLEEVTVTGIRSSLSSAVDSKRLSDSISDSIIAEEIGKSSDESIAEALSRVSGVSIDRTGSDNQTVTVRGIEASLNDVKLNGVSMTSNTNSQSVDLSLFSADILSQINVIKSPSAHQEEGSLGATILLQTRAPLEAKDNAQVLSIEGRYNDLREEESPRASFTFTQKLNEKIGIAGSVFYDDQRVRKEEFNQFSSSLRNFSNATDADTGEVIAGGAWAVQPNFFLNRLNLDDKTKKGGTGTFQYQPDDATDIRFDASFSRQEIDHKQTHTRMHNLHRTPNSVVIDRTTGGSNNVVAGSTARIGGLNQSGRWINTTDSLILGVQFEHVLDDYWTISGRVGHSSTEQEYTNGFRMNWSPSSNADVNDPSTWCGVEYKDGPEGDFLPVLNFCPSYIGNDGSTMRLTQIRSDRREVEDTKNSFYFDVDRLIDNSFITSVEFGVKYTDRSKDVRAEEVFIGATAFESSDPIFADSVDGSSLTEGHFLDGIAPDGAPTNWLFPDIDQTVALAFPSGVGPGTPNEFTPNPLKAWGVDEKTQGAYVQFNYEFLDGDFRGNFGVRYAKTEVSGNGHSGIRFSGGLPFLVNGETIVRFPVSDSFDYSNWLPSANFQWTLAEDLLLRGSAARVLARPTIDSLRPGFEIRAENNEEIPRGNGGNTRLDPFLADQFDLSLEWYFADGALLSGAVFYKDFKSYTYKTSTPTEFNNPLTNTCIVNRSELAPADVLTATAPCAEVNFEQTINGGSAEITGLELTYQQNYDFLPGFLQYFGTSVNYTYADSEAIVDPVNADNVFNGLPFLNTSKHSANATMFWENDFASLRLAYSYRTRAITRTVNRNSTLVRDDRGVLDFAANFNLTDDLKLTFSANNLTDSYDRILNVITQPVVNGSARDGIVKEISSDLDSVPDDRIHSLFNYGRNYRLSLRYSF